jgi:SPP1 gp7 family putative phage head morphogenesis protein
MKNFIKYKTLKPILDKQEYSRNIEKKILNCLYILIFKEIDKIINDSIGTYYNSNGDNDLSYLIEAIKKGRIQYNNGKFSGSFNAKISKNLKNLGAVYNKKSKTWDIKIEKLPPEIQQIIAVANIKFQKLHDDILKKLKNFNIDKSIKIFSFETDYETTLTDLNKQLYKTALNDVSVIPEFTEQMKKNIAKDYSNNLNLYIKNFTEEETLKLRDLVYKNTFEGCRAESLVEIIQQRYSVTKSKAQFLAKQETSLLVSKFRQQRYQDCGLNEYEWSGANDERERPDHKALNGLIFTWDNPPITDKRTGARNNPGEDYGCRCIAKPVIRF